MPLTILVGSVSLNFRRARETTTTSIRKHLLLFVLFLSCPAPGFALDSYIDIGLGITHSNFNSNKLKDGVTGLEDFDPDGHSRNITFGFHFGENTSLSLNYSDLNDTITPESGGEMRQDSNTLGLTLGYDLFSDDHLTLTGQIGYHHWKSTYSIDIVDINVSDEGYTPTIGFELVQKAAQQTLVGFQYRYYFKLGNSEKLYDREKLNRGDILGAITPESPADIELDAFTFFVRIHY